MPIKRNKPDKDFDSFVDKTIARVEADVVTVLCRIGAYGYDLAFRHGSYQDQTGRLRSSIGWGVARGGSVLKSGGFKQVLNGGEGVKLGRERLREIASQQGAGTSLIIVVGEKHAVYVEAMGYDVLTFSELQCIKEAENLFNAIFR